MDEFTIEMAIEEARRAIARFEDACNALMRERHELEMAEELRMVALLSQHEARQAAAQLVGEAW